MRIFGGRWGGGGGEYLSSLTNPEGRLKTLDLLQAAGAGSFVFRSFNKVQ